MIQQESVLSVADNCGAKKVMCIRVLGGSRRRYGSVGDVIVVAVKEALPSGKVKKGTVHKAVIVRTKYGLNRADGSVVKFDENAVVLLNPQNEPIGNRVFGPIARELRGGNFVKLLSMAPEVL